jgi:hypothetical protein
MNFTTATKVLDTIRASDDVRRLRGENRAKINDAANGAPPLSEDEAKKMNMRVNFNSLELTMLIAEARRQFLTAYYGKSVFFDVTLKDAPEDKASSWSKFITNEINERMMDSLEYFEQNQNTWASVVVHGPGPRIWYDKDEWCPTAVPIEDFVVPTDSEISTRNWEWFAVWHNYTPGELARKVFSGETVTGWKKEMVGQILNEYRDDNYTNQEYDWVTQPEKIYEIWKQNLGYWTSDAVPTIPLYHFYFKDKVDGEYVWLMRVVADAGIKGDQHATDFIFDNGQRPVATDLSSLLTVQYGDLNNKAPFMFHSQRSLGFLLYEPAFWSNLVRCRLVQFVMENFNQLFKVTDPAGKARAQKIELFDKAIIPEGVSIVPGTERHQVDKDAIEAVQSQMRQLMSEASASYTQQLDNGTQKEQTATETMAKMQKLTAMMSGILTKSFFYSKTEYREICRRFCNPHSDNPDVRLFQKHCQQYGIPKIWLDSNLWKIEVSKPLGGGNPTIGLLRAQQLLSMRPMFDGEAQQEILHEATVEITGDPRKADRWVKIGKDADPTDAAVLAGLAFGSLMQGVPVPIKRGLNPQDQIKTLFAMVGLECANAEKQGNMMSAEKVAGCQNVLQHVMRLVQALKQDKAQAEQVQKYMVVYGKLVNLLRGFAQRNAAAAKAAQSRPDPEAQAKANAITQQAQLKMATTAASTKQKMAINAAKFKAEQNRKNAALVQDQTRQTLAEAGNQHRANLSTIADAQRKKYAAFSE